MPLFNKSRLIYLVSISMLVGFPPTRAQEPVRAPPASAGGALGTSAKVYVYRYKQYVGSALRPSVYCDEVELARMSNGRYFAASLAPGRHTFRANDKQSDVVVDLKPGDQHFIRVELAQGLLKGHGRLVLVQKEQGAFEIEKLKPLGAEKLKDGERVLVNDARTHQP